MNVESLPLVEIYSKDGCHLCDVARLVVERVRTRHPFNLTEVKIQPGTETFEVYKELIPVIFVNGERAFTYKVTESELIELVRKR